MSKLIDADKCLEELVYEIVVSEDESHKQGLRDACRKIEAQPTIEVESQDLISRQAVIDALYDWSDHSITDAETWHIRQVIGDIKSMPSITPKQK